MTPRRPEITEDEVLRHNVWNLSYLLEKIGGLMHGRLEITQALAPGVYELEVDGVVNFSDELHPMTLVSFKLGGPVNGQSTKENQAGAEQYGEGDVRD